MKACWYLAQWRSAEGERIVILSCFCWMLKSGGVVSLSAPWQNSCARW
jgi:hypothetical protein